MSAAVPVERDGFSYAGDDLYVMASGHNRHRRATTSELRDLYAGKSEGKDKPAHWYEAQLLHYGLPPSKVKGTAKMRLFETVSKGTLAVPVNIQKLEKDLKKEWAKRERDAKQALKAQASGSAPAPSAGAKGKKRTAADANMDERRAFNISVSVKPDGTIDLTRAPMPKKAKSQASSKSTTTPKAKPGPKAAAASATPATPASPAKKTATKPKAPASAAKPKIAAPRTATTAQDKAPVKATKPTAKTTGARAPKAAAGAKATGPSTAKPTAAPKGKAGKSAPTRPAADKAAPRKKQTARWVGGPPGVGRPPQPDELGGTRARDTARQSSFVDSDPYYDEPPPPYPGSPGPDDANRYYDSADSDPDMDMMDVDDSPAPLGLLNGRYTAVCENGDHGGMILTLEGNALWGQFDFGPAHGIFYLGKRPWQSSGERLHFTWRGADEHYGYVYGGDRHDDDPEGYICFLGGGLISGDFDGADGLGFQGERIDGQGTRSEISAPAMRRKWSEYIQ